MLLSCFHHSPSEGISRCFLSVLFGHEFPTKVSRVKKIHFDNYLGIGQMFLHTLTAYSEGKKRNIIPHMKLKIL